MKRKRLFLIDGFAIAYRGYFALMRQPLTNSRGENTSAVYVFALSLFKILKDEKPDYIAVALDSPEPTFRHEQYEPYKATREKMPDDMIPQIEWIEEMIDGFRIPVIKKAGFEADDIMGTLARQAEDKGIDTYLVTGDKDFMQLISDHIKIYKVHSGSKMAEIIDRNGVHEKFGVTPEQITDMLGLMGDSSDNVPGVPKVGQKTASKLIHEYGSMENLLKHTNEVKGNALKQNLQEHQEQALLSKQLVTIDTKVPLKLKFDSMKVEPWNHKKLYHLFHDLNFASLTRELEIPSAPAKKQLKRDYKAVITDKDWESFLALLKKQKEFVFDTETTGLNPLVAEIVGLSFSFKPGEAYYIPVMDDKIVDTNKLNRLKPFLEESKTGKTGQNLKYDMLILSQYGIEVQGVSFDTLIAAYLLNPGRRTNNLDALALDYLNIKKIPISELIGTGRNQITMDEVPLEKITEYACEDADATGQLKTLFEKELKKNKLETLFNDVEMPLSIVLYDMEKTGVGLDAPFLEKMSGKIGNKLKTLETEIHKLAGEEFNINSTQQLGKILFEKLKIHEEFGKKKAKKTKTGYSTDAAVLEQYSQNTLVKHLLDYRQFTKLKNTYIDALPKLINRKTGRLHTSFNQTVTATGRLSSSDPNLQNIPFRTELGREIRRAFIPKDPAHVILSADYSQVELRLMAAMSKDKSMLEAFKNNEDIHRMTAAKILGVKPDEVTPELRNRAKSINFGIIYGMGAYGLARDAGIEPYEAQEFIDAYFKQYPGVKKFMDKTIEEAHENGFVKTLLGRVRYLPDLQSDNQRIVSFAENAAINTPLQGTAADLIKVAMIHLFEELGKRKLQSKIILQVHDELLLEVPKKEVKEVTELVREKMEKALKLDVPLKVDIRTGKNWLEAH